MSGHGRIVAGRLAGVVLAAGLIAAGGCAGDGRTGSDSHQQPASGRSESDRPAVLASPRGSVARSQLRERAIETLVELTTSDWPQVRANAIEGLELAPARLEGVLPVALTDENLGVRTVAAMALGRAGACELDALAEPLLEDSSDFARAAGIFALARCGSRVDRSPLARMLLHGESPRLRAHVAYLLGELGDQSAVPLLRQAAREPMPSASDIEARLFQLQVAEALYKLGDHDQLHTLLSALFVSRAEDLEATALAAQIIGAIGGRRGVNDLINLVVYRDETGQRMPAEVRLAAAGSLAKLGRRDGSFVADEYLDSESPVIRAQAAIVLGQTMHAENLPQLEVMLDDDSELVRVAAATGLLTATRPSR